MFGSNSSPRQPGAILKAPAFNSKHLTLGKTGTIRGNLDEEPLDTNSHSRHFYTYRIVVFIKLLCNTLVFYSIPLKRILCRVEGQLQPNEAKEMQENRGGSSRGAFILGSRIYSVIWRETLGCRWKESSRGADGEGAELQITARGSAFHASSPRRFDRRASPRSRVHQKQTPR